MGKQTDTVHATKAGCFLPLCQIGWDNAFVSLDVLQIKVGWMYQVFGEYDNCGVARLEMWPQVAVPL